MQALTIRNLLFVLGASVWPLLAFGHEPEFVVQASFIDMHTGPGRGYPKFYVIAKGESLRPIKQRTSWIKVEAHKGHVGWIRAQDLEKTRSRDGRQVRLP